MFDEYTVLIKYNTFYDFTNIKTLRAHQSVIQSHKLHIEHYSQYIIYFLFFFTVVYSNKQIDHLWSVPLEVLVGKVALLGRVLAPTSQPMLARHGLALCSADLGLRRLGLGSLLGNRMTE